MSLTEIYDYAEKNNINIYDFPMEEVISVSAPLNNSIAINTKMIDTTCEECVCLAHEIGHCMTGSFYNIYSDFDLTEKHEYTANKWAITCLIPKCRLENAFKKGIIEVWELAEYFNVTEDFIRKALKLYQYL